MYLVLLEIANIVQLRQIGKQSTAKAGLWDKSAFSQMISLAS